MAYQLYQFSGIHAGIAYYIILGEHSLYHIQCYDVIVYGNHAVITFWIYRFFLTFVQQSFIRSCHGNIHRNACADTNITGDSNLSTKQSHQVIHNGKPQSETVLCSCIRQAFKRFENSIQFAFWHTCTRISNKQIISTVLVSRIQCNHSAVGKLQSIGQQVITNLYYPFLVAYSHIILAVMYHKTYILCFNLRAKLSFECFCYIGQSKRCEIYLFLATIQTEETQKAVKL